MDWVKNFATASKHPLGLAGLALALVFSALAGVEKIPDWWPTAAFTLAATCAFGGFWLSFRSTPKPVAGGDGGRAKVTGRGSGAEGGAGGSSGVGPGGRGGDAEVIGDFSFARGGDGGNAGQRDGRGGRRTLSLGERMNLPTDMWKYGYGGQGANHPEYDRRLTVLIRVRQEYIEAFPDEAPFIQAGVDQVPVQWVNKRLEELTELWRVREGVLCYEMPPLELA